MKKCKHCKERFTPLHFNQKYCLKPECAKVWVDNVKEKQWKKRKSEMKENLTTVQGYVKEVQKVFNEYIRKRDKGLPCISCGKKIQENETVHASHYKPAGTCWATRFNEDNVHVSCVKCNNFLSGNLSEYRIRLVEKIGIERVEEVERLSATTKKFTIDELKEIINIYKNKLKK